MSSSSSDSEEDLRLKAASVTASDIFAKKAARNTFVSEDSRREHSKDCRYDLDPDCKKFLASKLDEMLEKTYKFTTKKARRTLETQQSPEVTGIRLFTESEPLTDVPQDVDESDRMKKRLKKKEIIPRRSATDEMLRSCAVSADWLLNQNPLRRT